MTIELISQIVQGVVGFLLAYFAYDFLNEFKKLRESVTNLHLSMVVIVNRLEHVESDHGRRLVHLEDKLL